MEGIIENSNANGFENGFENETAAKAFAGFIAGDADCKRLAGEIPGLAEIVSNDALALHERLAASASLNEKERELAWLKQAVSSACSAFEKLEAETGGALGLSTAAAAVIKNVRELFLEGDFRTAEALILEISESAIEDFAKDNAVNAVSHTQAALLFILKANLALTDIADPARFRIAMDCCQKALDTDPGPDAMIAIASLLRDTLPDLQPHAEPLALQPLYERAISGLQSQYGQKPADPDIASSLANVLCGLARLHANARQNRQALSEYGQSLDIYRNLASEDPTAGNAKLAETLNALGALHMGIGDHGAALAELNDATELFRELAKASPMTWNPSLATALNNLAILHGQAGEIPLALGAYSEALSIRRDLARQNPMAYSPGLARTLHNLAALHARSGEREMALSRYSEALALRQDLAQANPIAFKAEVARTLTNMAAFHADIRQPASALAECSQALDIYRELAKATGDTGDNASPDIAETLHFMATIHAETGQTKAALAECSQALDMFRKLAKLNPQAHIPRLAQSLASLARLHALTGEAGRARALSWEADMTMEVYAARYPEAEAAMRWRESKRP